MTSRGSTYAQLAGGLGAELALLRSAMLAAGSPERAAEMSAYMRGKFVFLGIPQPQRSLLQRAFVAASRTEPLDRVLAAIDSLWSAPEREFCYVAADTAYANLARFDEQHIVSLLPLADYRPWWDSADALRKTVGGYLLSHRGRLWPLGGRMLEGSMWQRRIALTAQLTWREQTDPVFLDEAIARNATDGEFFIQKAIGWALRDYSRTDPGWVREAIARHGLTGLARREAARNLPGL